MKTISRNMTIDVAKITEGEDACESKAVKRSDGKEVRSTVPCLRKVSHDVMCSHFTPDHVDIGLDGHKAMITTPNPCIQSSSQLQM